MYVNHSYYFAMILCGMSIALIAIFSDNMKIMMTWFPVFMLFMVVSLLVVFTKSKTTHTCPACQNTIGKTGTTISW